METPWSGAYAPDNRETAERENRGSDLRENCAGEATAKIEPELRFSHPALNCG